MELEAHFKRCRTHHRSVACWQQLIVLALFCTAKAGIPYASAPDCVKPGESSPFGVGALANEKVGCVLHGQEAGPVQCCATETVSNIHFDQGGSFARGLYEGACALVVADSCGAMQRHTRVSRNVCRLTILDPPNKLRQQRVSELVRAGEIDGQAALGPSWRGHVAACLHQRQRRHRALALTCVVQRRHAVFVPLVDLGPLGDEEVDGLVRVALARLHKGGA
mmetsp:Transcript_50034/g.80731  ORF Transcript_50034/g.80731 Transcript_50034/m.80731 type:complete len:222 (+) Transcript_50034:751-1416(+)